jgi:hypothetical protein
MVHEFLPPELIGTLSAINRGAKEGLEGEG